MLRRRISIRGVLGSVTKIGVSRMAMKKIEKVELENVSHPGRVRAFSFGTALNLVVVTTCIGYMAGLLIVIIWNGFALSSASG